jgi:hypothetical protein
MNQQDIQNTIATIMALKQLYDHFQPKQAEELKEPEQPKQEPVKVEERESNLRKQAYGIGLNGLSLNNMELK